MILLHEQHHGRNKPLMQDVVGALDGSLPQLLLGVGAARTTAEASLRSVSLGEVLCISESSPVYVNANGCLMSTSSMKADTPAPLSGISLNNGWGCAPAGAALHVQASILLQTRCRGYNQK